MIDYEKVLQGLVSKGLISKEDIEQAAAAAESETHDVIDITHSLLCTTVHQMPQALEQAGTEAFTCQYYMEAEQERPWALPTHARWTAITNALAKVIKTPNDAVALDEYMAKASALINANSQPVIALAAAIAFDLENTICIFGQQLTEEENFNELLTAVGLPVREDWSASLGVSEDSGSPDA